ncbi:MAG: hypothetical protein WBG86_09450 [Polyangiales bacterium]
MRTPLSGQFPILVSILLIGLATAGCKSTAPAPAEEGHTDHAAHAVPSPAAETGPPGPRLETDAFLLEVVPQADGYNVGKAGEVAIALEGRGEWHVNQDYPIRIDLRAGPDVGLQRDALSKDDAKEFTDTNARFVAGVEPAKAGSHEVTCDVSFAMCTDENCVLERRTLAMQVKVE